jgi:tetratricopeptide (TPR) repeat protein
MFKELHAAIVLTAVLVLLPAATYPQASSKNTSSETSNAGSNRGIELAQEGHCREALLILKKFAPLTADKQLKLKAGLATIRCALSLGQTDAAVNALLWMNREFPNDPDVLYVTAHAYSDLSANASLRLARTAAGSYQAHELNAESLEMQGKWDEAAAEYRAILEQDAHLQGIHFRIARLLLSKPETATTSSDAKNELEEELKIDPNNAGAQYVLGELSGRAQQWDEAIDHFTRATKLDAGLTDAFLGLGSSYVSAGKFVEAISPLEAYVKVQPGNPAGHYQLAVAYIRAGRKEDAKREAALQKEATDRIQEEKDRASAQIHKQSSGQESGKPEPPN